MDNNKKQSPTEKEIKDLVKKVDKLTKNGVPNASASGSNSAKSAESEAMMKAQLRQMMESMALMERAGKVKTTGKKDIGDHQFWKTQPVAKYGKESVCVFLSGKKN
jgi:glycylpeptide N-tetradecanoyltransferase